ncbi:uncharacterized protein misp3 [Misgurnus anguillicaudatus]|uniref:uncharacterized protein misp3 n=1 Tax=Misgurnus anguillicaudatus TaxID=75329 RepID=UPI003CCF7496
METDHQRSEIRDKCSSDVCIKKDSQFTQEKETQEDPGELKEQNVEPICDIEKTDSPAQPQGAYTSLSADGGVESSMESFNVDENDLNSDQAHDWPPVPEPDEETQLESDECQEGSIENTKVSEDDLTPVQDHITQMASEEEGCCVVVKLCDDLDSTVFVSEKGEEQNTDCKPDTDTTTGESRVNAHNIQQEELELNRQNSLNENEVEQQLCGEAPPLETGEPANQGQDSPACSPTEVKEPLTETNRDGEREERRERAETGGPEEEKQAGVEDQRQEQDNKGPGEAETSLKVSRMDGVDHIDDNQSDSGVSADFSPNSTTDASDAPQLSETPPNETPIEREIRLAMLREQNLRRSRGLDDAPDKTKEFVEIPVRRPILSQDVQSNPGQGMDKAFSEKMMQMEINAEREKSPGFYDKGTEAQLHEKKQLFESLQQPKDSAPTATGRPANPDYAAVIQEINSSMGIKQRQMQFSQNSPDPPAPSKAEGPNSGPPSALGPGLTEGTTAQIIIIETTPVITTVGESSALETTKDENPASVRASAEPVRQNVDVVEDKGVPDLSLVTENPFFKLRSSLSLQPQVEQDIKEAKEREIELQKQRSSLYGEAPPVEPEAEKATERDSVQGEEKSQAEADSTVEAVEAETTSSEEIVKSSPPSQQTNLPQAGGYSEVSSTPTSERQPTGKLDLMWPPPQTEEEQSEKTSRPPRQRTPLLDRWESGMVNGQVEDIN